MDIMDFPQTVDEFMEQYKIVDREEVYTNGAEMVPIFRMKQWFEHEALKKAPTALDHIHNVVAENERKRGYEQAKAEYDAKLEEIKSRFKDHYYLKGYEQSKVDAAPKWTPISERLPDFPPDEFIDVFCTVRFGSARRWVQSLSFHDGKWFYPGTMTRCSLEILAWMPETQPAPWKGEAE